MLRNVDHDFFVVELGDPHDHLTRADNLSGFHIKGGHHAISISIKIRVSSLVVRLTELGLQCLNAIIGCLIDRFTPVVLGLADIFELQEFAITNQIIFGEIALGARR